MKGAELTKDEIQKLAKGWAKGDKEAFSALYDHYIDSIFKFIYFKVKNEHAEDLTELVFIKAWENRSKYKSKLGTFSSWLYTIARNTVIDHYRVFKEFSELHDYLPDESESSNPKLIAQEKINAEKLREAINKLPEAYRDILLLRFIEDMEYEEIANMLGKSEGSIRITQFRAIKELRIILEKMGFNM